MSVFNVVGKIASIIFNILLNIEPFLNAIKALIPTLREPIEIVEEVMEQSGELADDFIDRNAYVFTTVRGVAINMQHTGAALEELMNAALNAAADDEVSADEIENIRAKALLFYEVARQFVRSTDEASRVIKKVEK